METTPPTGPDVSLYPAPGDVVRRSLLTLPKAKALAAFAADDEVPYVDLVECRQTAGGEVVVLDVRPEVPQTPVHDVRRSERVAVVFDAEDKRQPTPLALRTDFPMVPHVNVGSDGEPRSLCLFDAAYADQNVTWTAAGLARQLLRHLSETARGELHAEDQSLEQLFLGSLIRLVLPPAFFAVEEPHGGGLVVHKTAHEIEQGLLIAQERGAKDGGAFAVLTYTAKPRTHGVIRLQPRTLEGLFDYLEEESVRLRDALRLGLDRLREAGTPLDSPLVLVVRFPKRRTDDGEPETVEVWAFVTTRSLTHVGVDIGHWDAPAETNGVPAPILGGDGSKRGAETPLTLLNPVPALTRADAARYNGTTPDGIRYVAIGAGALGSHVFPPLVRAGHGTWTVVDDDLLLPHNVARHRLTATAVGFPKAMTMAHEMNGVYEENVAAGVVANVLEEPTSELRQALDEADVILDLAASVAVARHLALDDPAEGRRVSLFLSPSGTDLALLAEPEGRELRLDLIEMEYYRALGRDARLLGHLDDPDTPVRYAHACRDVSARIPDDAVTALGAIGARALRTLGPSASACVWRTRPDLTATRVDVEVGRYLEASTNGWTVSVSARVLERVYRQRVGHLPRETGGVLLGAFDTLRRRVYVVDFIPAPPDSLEWPTAYIRGAHGLAERIDAVGHATAQQLGYVGEWHSHPRGASLRPSGDDEALFAWLSGHRRFDGLPAVMAIVGDGRASWFVGSTTEPAAL